MALSDFKVPKRPVSFGDATVDVRGVSLNDISFLFRDHLTEVNRLMTMYEDEEKRETAVAQSITFATRLVAECPKLVASLIIAVADEKYTEELHEQIRSWPIMWQVETMRVVWELTTEEAGGAKKLFDKYMGLVKEIRPSSLSEG